MPKRGSIEHQCYKTKETSMPDESDADEIDSIKAEIAKLDAAQSRTHGINPARWERANDEINFQDLVEEFTGKRSSNRAISCPFHGPDRTPSFYFYPAHNNGFCFGCPPGEQFYDNIRFVARTLSVSRLKALLWLEKNQGLPPMDDVAVEDEEEEETVSIEFADLSEAYIRQAAREVQKHQDAELAEGFIRIYFQAQRDNDPVALARVLDPDTLQNIKDKKGFR